MSRVTINQSGDEFLDMLLHHHFGCDRSEQASARRTPSDDLRRADLFEQSGARFVEALLKRFQGEAGA